MDTVRRQELREDLSLILGVNDTPQQVKAFKNGKTDEEQAEIDLAYAEYKSCYTKDRTQAECLEVVRSGKALSKPVEMVQAEPTPDVSRRSRREKSSKVEAPSAPVPVAPVPTAPVPSVPRPPKPEVVESPNVPSARENRREEVPQETVASVDKKIPNGSIVTRVAQLDAEKDSTQKWLKATEELTALFEAGLMVEEVDASLFLPYLKHPDVTVREAGAKALLACMANHPKAPFDFTQVAFEFLKDEDPEIINLIGTEIHPLVERHPENYRSHLDFFLDLADDADQYTASVAVGLIRLLINEGLEQAAGQRVIEKATSMMAQGSNHEGDLAVDLLFDAVMKGHGLTLEAELGLSSMFAYRLNKQEAILSLFAMAVGNGLPLSAPTQLFLSKLDFNFYPPEILRLVVTMLHTMARRYPLLPEVVALLEQAKDNPDKEVQRLAQEALDLTDQYNAPH